MVDMAELSQVGKVKDTQTAAENADGADAFDAFRFEHYAGNSARQALSEKAPGQAPGQAAGEATGEAAGSISAQGKTELHESAHGKAGADEAAAANNRASAPDLERLRDPAQASAVLKEIEDWVNDTEKSACLDPELFAKTLNDFAWKTVESWNGEDGNQADMSDRANIYTGFDKLLDKLEDLKKGDLDWNRMENSAQERFYKNLPWEFMPHE